MESRALLFGHPIHQMLIVFPLGLLATALPQVSRWKRSKRPRAVPAQQPSHSH